MAMQSKSADFTGAEDYVDLSWDVLYDAFRLADSLTTQDGTIPGYRLINPADPTLPLDNTGVRVEPTARFTGRITVVNVEVLP